MITKTQFTLGAAAVVVIGILALAIGTLEKNNDQNWQIIQSVSGDITVRDTAGWYPKWFATVWTWPRADQVLIGVPEGDDTEPDYQSVRVTFNDGGTANCNVMLRYQYPTKEEERRLLHREFSGNPDNLENSIYQHVVNVIKATGPMMSSSEHQSARKGEFTQLVFDQSQAGIYQMRKVEKELALGVSIEEKPLVDGEGKALDHKSVVKEETQKVQKVLANEIIVDKDGKPIIGQESPLTRYGITITQLSITDVDYDPMTKEQFAAKKEAYLRAEKAKADRQNEVEQTLMVVQKGLRERAEVEAIANKEKASAVIAAQKEAEVAEQQKIRAETIAKQAVEVAKQAKIEAETKAEQELAVAKLERQAAEENAAAIITLAAAEEEKIAKAGAITEKERVLAQIDADMKVKQAEHLSKIRVPAVVMSGGGGNGDNANGDQLQQLLMNLMLLEKTGTLPAKEIAVINESSSSND